ncbi:MAG: general secretion pathway protein GspD [Pirellulales bacterium]|nr:general secretion pathway protein GspD [Pirellulales bacterium]
MTLRPWIRGIAVVRFARIDYKRACRSVNGFSFLPVVRALAVFPGERARWNKLFTRKSLAKIGAERVSIKEDRVRKTTTKLLASALAAMAFATPLGVWAGSQDEVLSLLLGAASLGDEGKSPAKLAEQYLHEARQAMQDGDLETANARIAAAESLNIKYSPLHLGDTPKKARATLDKLRTQNQLPSRRAAPYDSTKAAGKDAPHDPFMARNVESIPANQFAAPNLNPPRSGESKSSLGPSQVLPEMPAQPLPRAHADLSLVGNRYATALQGANDAAAPGNAAIPLPVESLHGAAKPVQVQPENALPSTANVDSLPAGKLQMASNPPMLSPPASSLGAAPNATQAESAVEKRRAIELTKQARAALERGDLATAEQMARQAMPIVSDSAYGPQDDRPGMVLLDVQKRKHGRGATPQNDHSTAGDRGSNAQALYRSDRDASRITHAGGHGALLGAAGGVRLAQDAEPSIEPANAAPQPDSPLPMDPTEPTPEAGTGEGLKWFRKGTEAMSQGQADQALQAFRRAYAFQAELDPVTRKRLQDFLQNLGSPVDAAPAPAPAAGPVPPAVENPTVGAATRKLSAEVYKQQMQARDMREKQPKQALELLERTKETVASASDVDQSSREQLIRRLEMSIAELRQYMTQNVSQIELDEQNRQVEGENERMQQRRVEVDARLAKMVDDFNKLCDEGRFAEAQAVAKRAAELMPDNPLAVQLTAMGRMYERNFRNTQVRDDKENGFWQAMEQVDEAAVPGFVDYKHGDRDQWEFFRRSKYRQKLDGQFRKTQKDIEIEQRLSTPVSLKFQERPLSEVVAYLGKIAQVPVYLDPEGLKAEGVDASTTMVNIDLTQDISLKSALKLILEPLHLTYLVKDEVLKITTEDQRRGQLYEVVYPVGDLVIPIPNFAPNGREGINAAFREAYDRQMGFAGATGGGFGANSPPYLASNQSSKGHVNPNVLGQVAPGMGVVPIGSGGPPASGVPQNVPFGPGGLQGGSQADFDPLIDLITGTIATSTWSELGGPGTIDGFDTTLSLVVSQTQEVHEQIADLLTQLRRLQDLQVTIEVRFITLRDEFFERIGLDFDANLATNTSPVTPTLDTGGTGSPPGFGSISPSRVVGLNPLNRITQNQDIQFRQNSFANALPPFGGFDPSSAGAATFGFAILSDIQAFFLIEAAQGDTRSNILQAPKVTLFNGQQATVSDQTQRPFVISVTPVVGNFAVGQQPVIVVLSEGTALTVQAVVSDNRRFVRLTVVPFFSQIGDVEEFTFNGSKTTKKSSSEDKKGDDEESSSDAEETSSTGTTVQLPEFSFVSVTTTVSVPDGGTVLLGGIKRLAEGRSERGVPILGKMPYVNRLFRNVGIGRTTSSLMMMVTPRIIIQEEEEENLLGTAPAP